ncbi:molecular chaperone [Sphingomonas arenae]|uniref:fimbrial biogenesis chaperone n=1 Tax=Sphingomonas arenae TaxID=2812555 RepID=UPI00196706EA|nr:fimbria/pilus periplasmic chaperone [Sphingomonas arenae]
MQPIVNVMQIPRDSRGITIMVRNPRNVGFPVTFEVVERKVKPDGTEDQIPADDLFTVFPAQAVIPAGKSQAVRVQWAGGNVDQSRSFTLYSAEVPVDLTNSGQSGVQRILRVGASVHIVPAGTAPKPVLEAAAPDGDGMKVVIRNDGNRFVYIDALSLAFGDKTVAGTELGNMAGRTLIPPGAKREFTVKGVSGQPTLKLLSSAL